jgi:hypothetical protein
MEMCVQIYINATGWLNEILLISVQGTVLAGYFSSSSACIINQDPSINMALKELGRSKATACSNGRFLFLGATCQVKIL